MMRRVLLLSALLAPVTVPAWAMSSPTPAGKDDHVRQVAYDPQNRTALVLQQGMVTNVTFDVMERIERVVLPDENGPVGLLEGRQGGEPGAADQQPAAVWRPPRATPTWW